MDPDTSWRVPHRGGVSQSLQVDGRVELKHGERLKVKRFSILHSLPCRRLKWSEFKWHACTEFPDILENLFCEHAAFCAFKIVQNLASESETVQTQRSAAGATATTVTTSSPWLQDNFRSIGISKTGVGVGVWCGCFVLPRYPPQQITEDVTPGKQWLRRQKAQDLREEAGTMGRSIRYTWPGARQRWSKMTWL